jgi:hypothetical protein
MQSGEPVGSDRPIAWAVDVKLANFVRTDPSQIVQLYLRVLGAGLLLEGVGEFVIGALPGNILPAIQQAFPPDPPHDALHIVWGLALLGLPLLNPRTFRPMIVALVFGVFYVALAFLGVFVYHPFGLRLDLAQNAFHFIVGPIALLLGLWAQGWGQMKRRRTVVRRPSQD